MLIRMNKSKYHDEFKIVLNFVDQLLDYSAMNQTFVSEHFLAHFNSGKPTGAGSWYLSKSRNSDGPVVSGYMGLFNALSIQERIQIREAFQNDICFYDQYDTVTFCFKSNKLPPKLKTALNQFIVPFYSQIFNKIGFDQIGTFSKHPFERSYFFEGYLQSNDNIKLCPACLCEIDLSKNLIADLDHYFPKHEYPALAILPDNLIPVCLSCNERVKLQQDPLDISANPGAIQRAFIPYKHEAIDELDIGIVFGTRDKFIVQLTTSSTEDVANARVNNLNRIYDLSGRWPGRLENMYDALLSDLAEDNPDWDNLDEWLKQKLSGKCHSSEKGKRKLPLYFLRMKLLETLLGDPIKFKAILRDLRMRRIF
ncbi:hypothetical protein [Paenibacillus radicis (ex Xue et al. 2023)]|uniref:HNH endonuclease n=1 Tax=Paenibacillus radicis (ex Xue et al. 2023) TaxID=2972489 RepID=A0ABT1YKE6_9BACL|nr:hypothetical protein [Paenibacillus radicis (ex Xue et al. 2023)]MCR8633200.1 hypothetical protein [Paenibacillus radicis (ex Xue et al. 2023)]